MLVLSYIPSGLEFWSTNHTSIYENSELNVFQDMKYFGEISSNWPSDLLGINNYKTRLVHNHCKQNCNGLILLL